jgi:hypothetical protein
MTEEGWTHGLDFLAGEEFCRHGRWWYWLLRKRCLNALNTPDKIRGHDEHVIEQRGRALAEPGRNRTELVAC